MAPRSLTTTLLALVLALLVPATAIGCTIPIRTIGPVTLRTDEIVRPKTVQVDRSQWTSDAYVASTRPRLSQWVIIKGVGRLHGISYKSQKSLSIDAYGPEDHGWMYFNDDDPETRPCEMVGQLEWQPPVIRVVQGAKKIRFAATSARTKGDRMGCTYGPDLGAPECPNLTRNIIQLKKPVGDRIISMEVFA